MLGSGAARLANGPPEDGDMMPGSTPDMGDEMALGIGLLFCGMWSGGGGMCPGFPPGPPPGPPTPAPPGPPLAPPFSYPGAPAFGWGGGSCDDGAGGPESAIATGATLSSRWLSLRYCSAWRKKRIYSLARQSLEGKMEIEQGGRARFDDGASRLQRLRAADGGARRNSGASTADGRELDGW